MQPILEIEETKAKKEQRDQIEAREANRGTKNSVVVPPECLVVSNLLDGRDRKWP